ncbi:MAG: c-type cytochrome [Phycisphaerae bacterium]|nr:c-type cytochrome [Gemmatimonadaceae bacterium]
MNSDQLNSDSAGWRARKWRPAHGPVLAPRVLSTLCLALSVAVLQGCTDLLLPEAPGAEDLLEGPIDDLTAEQRGAFLRGDAEFSRTFSELDGLGPIFIAQSCESCHAGDGKGHPLFNITRFGKWTGTEFSSMASEGGPQLQQRAIRQYLGEVVPPSSNAIARFTPPSVTGLGLLEAVSDADILANVDVNDANGDGVSGRAHWADSTELVSASIARSAGLSPAANRHVPINGKYLGRFGKKGRVVTLLQQTTQAYIEDMGVTSELLPHDIVNPQVGTLAHDDVADPEVPFSVVDRVTFYLRTLRPPPRRESTHPEVRTGEALFVSTGCATCHTPSMRTGKSDIAALSEVQFAPFTDLLLHDMGADLDDKYTEGSATSAEWRTAPLWGLGLAEGSQGGTAYYLHDGRARTLRAAIGFHGGEGSRSRSAFNALTAAQQEQLLRYLRSL